MDSKSLFKHRVNNLIHSVIIFAGMILLVSLLGWSIGGTQGMLNAL